MFDWFKPKNKRNIVLPSEKIGPLRGVDLIQAFSPVDEPKARDFPKDKYKAYWEIVLDAVPGGYSAVVRFYSYKDGFLSQQTLTQQNVVDLRQEVTNLILSTMKANEV